MDLRIIRTGVSLLLLSFAAEASDSTANETWPEELRQPRVSGRIVKLYSGTKPDAIYCANEGFQADPANCAIFYRCVKGASNRYTVFRFQCGPGTIYDPETEVCNFPSNTKRSECGSLALSPNEKHKENEIEEAESEVPSPISTRPVNRETSQVISTEATSKPQFTQQSRPAWMTTGTPQSMPPKPTSIGAQPGRQEGDLCTADGFMGDSENCRKFYRCVGNQRGGFIRYEFMCSDTTVWDEDVQSCNHPWAVQRSRCGRGISNRNMKPSDSNEPSSTNIESTNTVQQQLQISYGQKVSQTQTQISHGAAIQNQTQINYGDRENKDRNSYANQNQTQISHGSAISQTQTQINHANNGAQTQLQIDHTKDSSQAQSQVYETTSSTTTEKSNGAQQSETYRPGDKDGNTDECSESGFMGDKNNCNKFYRCVDNGRGGFIKYEFACGEGTVWDSSIEACNHAWAVKDCGRKKPQSDQSSTTSTITTSQNYQTTSQSNQIEEYTDLDTGYGHQQQSQQTSSSTEQTKTTTEPAKPMTTPAESHENSICESIGFMGDSNDCKKFHRCVDNGNGGYTKYDFTCGEGTVWDSEIEACNHAWAVKKCGGNSEINKEELTTSTQNAGITTVTLMEVTTQSVSQLEDDDSGYGSGPVQQSESSTTKSTNNPPQTGYSEGNEKECSQEGFVGDDEDCKKFYRCVDNGRGGYIKYEFNCGEGTVWDSEINDCNHERDVKKPCSNISSTQSESVSETSSESGIAATSTAQTTDEPKSTDKPTSSKPTSGKECIQEGFMGDNNDCRKFYRCVDNGKGGFTKYEFMCGEGTVWDPEITACNHPLPNQKCKGTFTQGNSNPSTEPNREDDEPYTESTNDSSTSSTAQSYTTTSTTSQKPQSSDDKCTSEGFFGNSNDCKKFYRCVDNGNGKYTKYDFTCGDGTVWDQEIQACNHESSNPECSQSPNDGAQTSHPQIEATGDSSTTYGTAEQVSTEKTEPPSNDSSGKCESEGFFANPNDCKKFYRCVANGNGGYTRYDFSCGDGTVWVQEIQACDHDDGDSSCVAQSGSSSSNTENYNPTTSSTSSTTTSMQEPAEESEDNQSGTSNQKPSTSDSDSCTGEGFYPNKNDCKRFYRCVGDGKGGFTKYEFACGEGTAWDSDIQSCNHIGEVKNCQSSSLESNQQEEQNVQEDESNTSGTTSSTSSPASENSKPTSKDSCTQEGYYGNTQDCTKFYRCVDNGKGGLTKYDFDCGEGTIWDQDVTTCNHPQDVTNPSCQQTEASESSTSSSSTTTSASGSSTESPASSSSTTESSSNSSDCSGTTKKPANKDVNCTKEGYYPDPNDCKKFYRCVDWDGDGKRFSVYHFECGEGTIWDPALDTCNHEDSVYPPRDCSGGGESQSENVGSEETSTNENSTTEQQTTQESTTSEQTNAQQTTEPTTTQQTTEQTTTQQTTEQTTTQQTTEQTTTQQTTEQTTTQQTTEKTTTQQSTEETTTQQTTEKTTTQQSIEETTTQQTTEKTTTQETTEQTTTQQTTEQTTTQETAEEHTTLQSTTEKTTQESTSSVTTEQSTTGEQTTTQQSETTEQTTSTQNNENETTTQENTDRTTQETTEGTTQESTTENSTDETQSETTEESGTESTTESEQESTTESSSSDKECPETDDDQNLFVCPTSFRRHPKYCNIFYQCTEDDETHDLQIATFRCPNETIYDESQTKCVEEKKADKKCDGEIAQKRRVKRGDTVHKEPIVVTNERLKCPTAGHFPFEKQECSPAFLKCQKTKVGKLRGFVYQCPENHVYWSVSRRCELKSYVRDCNHSYNIWSNRWEIPLERRNVAP